MEEKNKTVFYSKRERANIDPPINQKWMKKLPPGTQASKFFVDDCDRISVVMEKTYKSGITLTDVWFWDDVYDEWTPADKDQMAELIAFFVNEGDGWRVVSTN